jgi:hypothetical protein
MVITRSIRITPQFLPHAHKFGAVAGVEESF